MTKIEIGKEYQWNEGFSGPLAHCDINKVIEELSCIEEAHGEITPKLVVESSKNKKSILHNYFEWDNEKAADKWREKQAIQILGRIEVKTISNGEARIVRVFQVVKKSNNFSSETKYSSSSSSSSIISGCINDLSRVRNKLHGHEIISPIEYIDKALAELNIELGKQEKKTPLAIAN